MVKKALSAESVTFDIEIVTLFAAVILVAYLLLTLAIYPQKIQSLKEALTGPSVEEEVSPPPAPDPESEYQRAAKMINKEHNFGQFETKLLRIGFFKGQFRADIVVKNVGKETADFFVERAFAGQGDLRYDYAGGSFVGKQIAPNEIRSGYVLYKGVPQNLKGAITVVIGNSLAYSTIFGAPSSSPHIFLIEL